MDELGWSVWLDSFSSIRSLMTRVAFSARAYLLAMVNISSNILGFFMASLRIKDDSVSPFLKNVNGHVVNLWDDVSFIAETLDEFPEGLSLLLDDTG
jgi:hypothetical protein